MGSHGTVVLGEEASAKFSNVKPLVDEITARPAAAKVIAQTDKFTFKTRWTTKRAASCLGT
jgi:GST-like protein